MRGRFSTTNINILRGVSSLSPESPTFLDLPELKALWLILHCDTVLLNNEIEVLKPMLKQSKSKILLIYILKLYHFNKLFQLLCPQWKIFEKRHRTRSKNNLTFFKKRKRSRKAGMHSKMEGSRTNLKKSEMHSSPFHFWNELQFFWNSFLTVITYTHISYNNPRREVKLTYDSPDDVF